VKATSPIQLFKLQVKNLFDRLRESSFVKNVLIVMTGTAAAQILGFAIAPIISRLFTPSDFGVFGSFNAVLMVIAAGATLDYAQAIMLPKEKEDAINLFILSCVSTAIITACCFAVCLFAPTFLQDLMKAPNAWFLVLLVVAILVSGLNRAFQAWSVRVKAFKHTSASQVIRSLSSNGSQVGLGYLKWGSIGLVCATILGDVLASVNLLRVLLPDLLAFRRCIRWERIKQLAKDYRDFPIYSAPREVINALSRGLPVLLLAHFYGIAVAGAYAFGVRIMSVPMRFVLQALRQVLFQKASESYNYGGRLMLLYIKTTGGLFVLALFPSLVLFIWAPQIFTWIFGSQWHTAGEFARWLVLWLTVMFCNLPSTLFAQIIRMQRQAFIFDIVLLAVRAIVLIVGGMYLSALHTILLFSIIGGVMNIIWIVIVGCALMRKEGDTDWRSIPNFIIKGDSRGSL
jgi:lipopolysaccharide exporter